MDWEKYRKECRKCKKFKPLGEFYKNKSNRDGRHVWCILCHKQQKKMYRARVRNRLVRVGYL